MRNLSGFALLVIVLHGSAWTLKTTVSPKTAKGFFSSASDLPRTRRSFFQSPLTEHRDQGSRRLRRSVTSSGISERRRPIRSTQSHYIGTIYRGIVGGLGMSRRVA